MKYYDALIAASPPPDTWKTAVDAILARYAGAPLPLGEIVFAGSSSFTLWHSLPEDFLPLECLNHGFGGAQTKDMIYYLKDLIIDFHPSAVVYFIGTNDMSSPETAKEPEQVLSLVAELLRRTRAALPDVPVFYLSITTTPARRAIRDIAVAATEMIREFCEQHGFTYVDVNACMLLPGGETNPACVIGDQLHPSRAAYDKWIKIIKPLLEQ